MHFSSAEYYVDFLKSGKTGDGAVALPQVLDWHGLANDKKCRWYFYEKKKRMALSTRLRSSNSLVRSNVPRGELKIKLMKNEGKDIKSKVFQVSRGLASTPSSPLPTGWDTSLLQGTTSIL